MAIAPLAAALVTTPSPGATRPVAASPPTAPTLTAAGAGASSFAGTLGKLVEGVERTASEANAAVGGMLAKNVDVHDAMIALQRSELSLQLAVQVRNKLVQAYQDIMRMPI
jgi:flagellar hook-basal body complex protein FliE